jgi:hypothetical protein
MAIELPVRGSSTCRQPYCLSTLAGVLAEVPEVIGVKLADGDAAWYEAARRHLSHLALFVPGHHRATGVREGVAAGAPRPDPGVRGRRESVHDQAGRWRGAGAGDGSPGPQNRGLEAALRRLRQKAGDSGIVLPFQIVHSIGVRFTSPLDLV